MVFEPKTLDYELSPYTGLTRESWMEAGKYLLSGIFQHIRHLEDPVVMPRKETEVTYPHSEDNEREKRAEYFEGLARSFFIAAPLIQNEPDVTVSGYKLRDYYKYHVLKICARDGIYAAGHYDQMLALNKNNQPFCCFQQTVETCALVICLWISKKEIWDTYTKEEKDEIADFLSGYAHGNTVPQNWRLFNMLDLAFLHQEGYPIDKDIMRDHAMSILNYYAGDGWYRDGHSFDYYSCWAFNVYAPIWCQWYGYQEEPEIAARFEEHSNKLMETYGDFFDRDGFTNMWGRSNIYRNAATSAFDGNMMLAHSTANLGLARRISSGSLLQFLKREDFLYEGIPTLGFYGQFTPLVQGYSCAESPLWLGKAFLCLHLPKEHPFWTAIEENGTWEYLKKDQVKETTLDGPALCFTNHEANGETVLRTGKVVKNQDDRHGMWNYSKLTYNTKYPWESSEQEDLEAQQYVLQDLTEDRYERANVTFWAGEKEGVLYRRQFFQYRLSEECHWMQAVNLADFPVPSGIFRANQLRLHRRPVRMTLGSYGFPDNKTEVIRKEENGAKAIILKGHDATGREKQMAMTIYDGWDKLEVRKSRGTNPDSENSLVICASLIREKQYGYEPYVMISQVITKENLEDFTDAELFPVEKILYADKEQCGGYGPIRIQMKNGTEKEVEYEGIEGNLSL